MTPNHPLRIHLIAICGTAMAPLAVMLKAIGHHITGSDSDIYPPMSTVLEEQGIAVYQGFDETRLDPPPDLVIIGNAISRGNPKAEAVLARKIPYMSQAAALREFFLWDKTTIVITGTHGKTTTTTLLAWVLQQAGLDPSYMIGGVPIGWESGAKLGAGRFFVLEGDEYDSAFFDKRAKFLNYLPDIVIINNIEFDHADVYDSLDEIILAFQRLVNLVPGNGLLIGSADDDIVRSLLPAAHSPVQSFGQQNNARWQATGVMVSPAGTRFDVIDDGTSRGAVTLPMFGVHNVQNALAGIAIAQEIGIEDDVIRHSLAGFKGVKRRFTEAGVVDGITIIDDYGHHPVEISAVLAAARANATGNVIAVVQPHRYSRLGDLFEEFCTCFNDADTVIVADVYAAGEEPIKGVDRDALIAGLQARGHRDVVPLTTPEDLAGIVAGVAEPEDIVVCLGAGNITQWANALPAELGDKRGKRS